MRNWSEFGQQEKLNALDDATLPFGCHLTFHVITLDNFQVLDQVFEIFVVIFQFFTDLSNKCNDQMSPESYTHGRRPD